MESSLTPADGGLVWEGGLHMKPWQHGEEQRGWASDLQRTPVAVVQSQTHLNNTSGLSCWDYRLSVRTRWGTENTHITVRSLCPTASWTIMITVRLTSSGPSFYCCMWIHIWFSCVDDCGLKFSDIFLPLHTIDFPCNSNLQLILRVHSLKVRSIWKDWRERPQFWPPR